MMALQENLAKFRKQQEKCQSLLSSIAATPPNALSSVNLKPPAPAVKFSNDTERLRMINNIRKSSDSYQIKRVLDLLQETREALTPEQINEACYVDLNANKAVFESLKNNPKVKYDGRAFSYKAKHEVKSKDQLLALIQKYPKGMPVTELKDAYPSVMDDLQVLKAERKIWLLLNSDSQEDMVYPNDPRVNIRVDDDIKQLFRSIELPSDMLDIEKDLAKHGMKPATNTAERRAAAQILSIPPNSKPKKKQREISKRTKLTNAHLPELFQNLSKH